MGMVGVLRAHPRMTMASMCAAVARVKISGMPLALTLATQHTYGTWGRAGLAVACYVTGIGLFTPIYARLFTRHGEHHTGRTAVTMQTILFLTLTLTIHLHAPYTLVCLAAFVAGMGQFSIISLVRARWTRLTRDKELTGAFAWETIMDDTTTVLGPLIVTMTAMTGAMTPLITLTTLTTVGGIAYFMNPTGAGQPTTIMDATTGTTGLWRPVTPILACFLLTAGAWSALTLTATANIGRQGGMTVALAAVGSILGGVIYGIRAPTPGPRAYMTCQALTVTGFTLMTLAAATMPVMLAWVSMPACMAYAPATIIMNLHLERVVPAGRYVEALAWVQSSIQFGLAGGNTLIGLLLDHAPAWTGLAAATLMTFAAIPMGARALRSGQTGSRR